MKHIERIGIGLAVFGLVFAVCTFFSTHAILVTTAIVSSAVAIYFLGYAIEVFLRR